MADATDADIRRMIWSGKGYPIYELVAKYVLPMYVKSANSRKSDRVSGEGIVAHQIYRFKRMLRIEKIIARTLSPASSGKEENASSKLQISIPKDYRGSFQILPFESNMSNDISLDDVIKYRPKFIKVVETVYKITTGVQINLDAGDELEVLETRLRATKEGVKEYLKLRKDYREFILNPDCQGKFKVIDDTSLYTLHEILDKFPLPQRVLVANIENHSEAFKTFLPTTESGSEAVTLMLKEKTEEEYVVGEDLQKQMRAVLHVDAELYFYIPDTINPHGAESEINRRTIYGECEGDEHILVDHFICRPRDKLVMCGTEGEVFRKLVLHPRLPSRLATSTESTDSSLSPTADQGIYGNIGIKPTVSKDVVYGKVGAAFTMFDNMPDKPPPRPPPKSPIGTGDRYSEKLLTPDETRDALTSHNSESPSTEPSRESDYVDLRNDSEDSDVHDYESVTSDEEENDSSDYIDILDDDEEEVVQSTYFTGSSNHPKEDNYTVSGQPQHQPTTYENTTLPRERKVQQRKPPEIPQATGHKTYLSTPALPTPTRRSKSFQQDDAPDIPLDHPPSITRSSSVNALIDRKSVRGVDRPSSPVQDEPPELPPRHTSLSGITSNTGIPQQFRTQQRTSESAPTPRFSYEDPKPLPDIVTHMEPIDSELKSCFPKNQEELEKMSVKQVVHILEALKFNDDVQARFEEECIDGELFCSLNDDDLIKEFGLSKFQARKIVKFINGWRPQL